MKWRSKIGFASKTESEHEGTFTQFRDWLKGQRDAPEDMIWSPMVGECADVIVLDFERPNILLWPLNQVPWDIYNLYDYESEVNYLCFVHPTKTPGNFRLIVERPATRFEYLAVQKLLVPPDALRPRPCEASMGPDRWWFVRSSPWKVAPHAVAPVAPVAPTAPNAAFVVSATTRLSRGLAAYEGSDLAARLGAMKADVEYLLRALKG